MDRPSLSVVGLVDEQNTEHLQVYISQRMRQMMNSIQPIACISDQQAGHVTRRPTIASKNSSQGLPQQLSNLQIRRAIEEIP